MAEAFLMTSMNRGNDGQLDRILDAPTNEAWIDPWVALLKKKGVRFHVGQTISRLDMKKGKVVSVRMADAKHHHRTFEADYFVAAMPAERARKLWSRDVLAADPHLEQMNELYVDWMNGIQFFLKRHVEIAHGHAAYMDSPWAVTSISQAEFWKERDFPKDYGDGVAIDCLSCDVSDWDTPGSKGKPAKRCPPGEVAAEVWKQLKDSLNDSGEEVLRDDDLHSWSLDPAIKWNPARGHNSDDEPLLVNTVGTWPKRPTAQTKIHNLFLAGDYVQTNIDLATMEGANESGRAAVNALLDVAGSKAPKVKMFSLYRPPEYEAAKQVDLERWKAGQPNAFDVDTPQAAVEFLKSVR
jgi:uncharacterized protein with NAD-binding domain and iron-sulfur cluster